MFTRESARRYFKDLCLTGRFDYALPEPEPNEQARQSPSGRGYTAQLALMELIAKFDREAQTVERDERLTAKGKSERIAELAREALQKVNVLRVRLYDPIVNELAEIQKQAASPGRRPGDIEQLLLQREVRDRLLQKDDIQRVEILRRAVEDGDTLTVEAILGAPRIARLVPAEVEEEARQNWFARRNPEVAARLEEGTVAKNTVERNFNGVRAAFEALAGVEPAAQITQNQ